MIVSTPFLTKTLIPNVGAIAREMTSSSQISIILRRVRNLSISACVRLGIHNLKFLPLLVKKDFATGIKLLCELEILASPSKRSIWMLHNQMTDMAIALNNTNLLQFFFTLAKTYGFTPGVLTYNPERCIQFLSTIHTLPKNLIVYCPRSSASFHTFAQATHVNICFIEGEK